MSTINKDVLQDIIQHTGLDDIELIKITGTAQETLVTAVAESRTVILNGKFKAAIPDFVGVFGMPNIPKLKTILGFSDEYDDNAKITVVTGNRGGINQPESIHFENKTGDFVNDYRLMSKEIVEEKVKNVLFKGASWGADFEPGIAGIMRLKKQSSVHTEEEYFTTKMTAGSLHVSFGGAATHSGNFVFQSGITGALGKTLNWPVKQFLRIMDLSGTKRLYISDQGVMKITVDSGIADYEYLIPAKI